MKKLLAFLLAVMIITATLPFGALTASAETEGYYTYTVTDGKATITEVGAWNYPSDGVATIPSTLGGYPVTAIGEYAFGWWQSRLKSIVIPNSVTSIGYGAFSSCDKLESVVIPDSVTSIGTYAFESCTGLTSITIPDSVTEIGEWAFEGCEGLKSITIPDGVTEIEDRTFANCSGLESLTIGKGVTLISQDAFDGCTGLTSITVKEGNTVYRSSGNCLIAVADKRIILGCNNSVIPSDGSVTLIGNGAFRGCYGLVNIEIPNTITSIGNSAFADCTGLTSVTIPDSVTSIDYYAFSGCTGLTSLEIPASVTYIGGSAFGRCSGLESITVANGNMWYRAVDNCLIDTYSNGLICGCKTSVIPTDGSITIIESGAFAGCKELENITIPNSVTSILSEAFAGCTGLTNIEIPASVAEIGIGAFSDCTGLTSITVDEGNPKYHSSGNCLIETDSKTIILGCNKSVIPSDGSVTIIGSYAFENCKDFKKIDIPNTITTISYGAFANCAGLTSITLTPSVTEIGWSAFLDCDNLEYVYFYGSKEQKNNITISEYSNVDLEDALWLYSESKPEFGYYIEDEQVTIYGFKDYDRSYWGDLVIPSEIDGYPVTTILSFDRCAGITSITIPASVTTVEEGTFSGCIGIKNITVESGNTKYRAVSNCLVEIETKTLITGCNYSTIPADGSVTSIGKWAFSGFTGLTSIEIPDSVISIGTYAFSGCTGLTNIEIPASVTEIGTGAFECGWLESITVNAGNTIYHSSGNCLIETDSKTLLAGCSKSEIPSDGSVTLIGFGAFQGCYGLVNIEIPNTVTKICTNAFTGCTALSSITIHVSLKTVEEQAFGNCEGLKDVYYCGTSEQSTKLSITNYFWMNDYFINAKWHYSDTPEETQEPEEPQEPETGFTYNIFNENEANITGYNGSISGTLEIPSDIDGYTVTSIDKLAFENRTDIKSLVIPATVCYIGPFSFRSTTSLESVTLNNPEMEAIEDYAFTGCTALKDVYFAGTSAQKAEMYIGETNDSLLGATWHCSGSSQPEVKNFPDVNYKDWYGPSVAYAVGAGLMKGYGSGKFGTADGIQRQDFVIILSRISGDDLSQYEGKTSFKDVSKGAYYAAALAWAKAKGVSSGYANGKFGVGDKVTREQIMVFLYNYAKLKGYDTTATMTEAQAKATYADFGKVSGYAKEAALWALSKGVVSGKDAGGGKKLIAPQANALRCEVAAMFYNIEQKGIFE